MKSGKLYKQGVAVLGIVEHANRFLLLRRVDSEPIWHGKWELPGGGVDPGETTLETLYREIDEETGLAIIKPELLGVHTHTWELSDHIQQMFLIIYRCQASRPAVTLSSENDAFEWTTPETYLALGEMLGSNKNLLEELYFPVLVMNKE